MPPPHFVDSFCAGSNWSPSVFSSFSFGKFTTCFTEIVILGVLHVCMLIMAALRLYSLRRRSHVITRASTGEEDIHAHSEELSSHTRVIRVRHRWLYKLQVLATFLLFLIPVLQLNGKLGSTNGDSSTREQSYQGAGSLAPFEAVSLTLTALAWLSVSLLLASELRWTMRSGLWLYRFLFLFALFAQSVKLTLVVRLARKNHDVHNYFFGLYLTFYALVALLALAAVAHWPGERDFVPYVARADDVEAMQLGYAALLDGERDERERPVSATTCPERRASWCSMLSFSWMTPLMSSGYRKPLDEEDVWGVDDEDEADHLYQERYLPAWWAQEEPTVERTLRRVFFWQWAVAAFPKLFNDGSQFVGPIFLARLIDFIGDESAPDWHGYAYAGAIFVGAILGALGEGQYFQRVMRTGLQVRSVIMSAVFNKAMVLSNSDAEGTSVGKSLNLMASDAATFQSLLQNLHAVWSAPLRIIVALVLLYQQLGYSALVGASVLIMAIPVQKKIVGISARYLKESLARNDTRVKLESDVFGSIQVVKCYAWEDSFVQSIRDVREEELLWLKKSAFLRAWNSFLISSVPILVSVVSLGVFVAAGNDLTPSRAFTSLSLFGVIRAPLWTLPQLITQIISAKVSMERLEDYLGRDEQDLKPRPLGKPEDPAIEIKGSFCWKRDQADMTLKDVNLKIPRGALVGVIGATGHAKSSLLSAMLGEMHPGSAQATALVRGRVSYAPQQAWIFNATVRQNILFGQPYDCERYNRAVTVSALKRDFELLSGGDLEEIGEKGVNLSGGQKQRVAICRAVYADSDVVLLDDPLSALDAHVGKRVFEECIAGELSGRTRVLVTNQLQFISQCDMIVMMREGRIEATGSYEELLATSESFAHLMSEQGHSGGASEEPEDLVAEEDEAKVDDEEDVEESGEDGEAAGMKLVQKEHRDKGTIAWSTVTSYFAASGSRALLTVVIGLLIFSEVCRLGSSYWLSEWSSDSVSGFTQLAYVAVYAAWSFGQALLAMAYLFVLAVVSIQSGRKLHYDMLATLLRAPIAFFHMTPLGRVLNRFSKDVGDTDQYIAQVTSIFARSMVQMAGTFLVIGITTPYTLATFVPVLCTFWWTQRYFQATSRELKRLDSVSRSPIFAHFEQCLQGMSLIRAARAHNEMAAQSSAKLNNHIRFNLASFSANRWLGVRLELLGSLMIMCAAVFVVAGRHVLSPQTAGLALSYALQITALLNMVVRLASVAENYYNSVERILEYSEVESEAPPHGDTKPPPEWPAEGAISFENVRMGYRDGLPDVLHGVSFDVEPGEKIGLVGRTGSAKTTTCLLLFRLSELRGGRIVVDGVDIADLGLHDLRSKLAIIPQEPCLFLGTVRSNLDPFNEFADAVLWDALERSHLREYVEGLPLQLDAPVEQNGANFSVGQRQLICMARALVRHATILVLDEATSAIDMETDALIQQMIRTEFAYATTLTVAHRLNTIIDSTRILVMDAGNVVEYGTPAELVSKPGGHFASMVDSTGPESAEYLRRAALGEVEYRREVEAAAAAAVAAKPKLERRHSISQLADVSFNVAELDEVRDAIVTIRRALKHVSDPRWGEALGRAGVSREQWTAELSLFLHELSNTAREQAEDVSAEELMDGGVFLSHLEIDALSHS